MPFGFLTQSMKKFEPQLLAAPGRGARMRFVHDDALRCNREKVLPMALTFDVVKTDHDHRMVVEQGDAVRQIPLDAGRS